MALFLAGTSALIQLTTSAAQEIMVQASYADYNGTVTPTTVTPGTLNTTISTATTTTVVGSPASNIQRNIKRLSFFNTGSAANNLTVQHTDGTTPVTLKNVTLQASETLTYTEETDFTHANASGAIMNAVGNGAVSQTTSSSALTPTSTSAFVMGGLGALITPAKSGNIEAKLYGYLTSSVTTVDEGIILQLAYASGSSGPSYQAAATGTVVGKATEYSVPTTAGAAADVRAPVALGALITGLLVGTSYWFDFQMEGITAEDVSLNNAVLILTEY